MFHQCRNPLNILFRKVRRVKITSWLWNSISLFEYWIRNIWSNIAKIMTLFTIIHHCPEINDILIMVSIKFAQVKRQRLKSFIVNFFRCTIADYRDWQIWILKIICILNLSTGSSFYFNLWRGKLLDWHHDKIFLIFQDSDE